MAISASGVPDGMYFGGGESEEEDGGFVFGDSPPAAQSHWGFVAEPTVAAVTKKVPPGAAMENGGTSSSEEGEVNGVCGGTNGKLRTSLRGFGHPPRPRLGNHAPGVGRGARRKKGGRGSSGGNVAGRGRVMEEGEEVRVMVTHGNTEEMQRILESGFDPNTPLKSGWPALLYACDCGSDTMTELLLSYGANPNTQKDMFNALMAVCCSKADKDEVLVKCARLLINKGARVNTHDRHHMSPLLYACQNSRVSLSQLLISVNADVNKQDSRGWTPLFYAAETGNFRFVQSLLGAGANPEIVCNAGDTASTIANDRGYTNIADLLEGVVASAQPGQPPELKPHPLLVGVNREEEETKGDGTGTLDSSSSSVRYGDLELFLLGIQLAHLLPLFKTHQVKFSDLLSMTDVDLQQMGVAQVGARKRILDAILEVHRKEWEMPKQIVPRNKSISPPEAAVILSHLTKHTRYIRGTASFLLTHTKTNPDLLDPNMETEEAEKLTHLVTDAVAAVSELQAEVKTLQTLIHSALGNDAQSKRTAPEGSLPSQSGRMKRVVGVVVLVGVATMIGGGLYFGGRTLVDRIHT